MSIKSEVARRRTFAIISHPDAGKTTLTEKFLLYGGAKKLAGSVTEKKHQSSTSSDWMEMEKKRGISISSTVLQFEYDDYVVNLLDTPGHKDFSEDTYRVLTAVDAVIMVVDAGKGIENQTKKLFSICKKREIPIFTLMNKLDRPAKDPLELIDELESVLGINAFAVNWPLGSGDDFKGIFDRIKHEVHLFEHVPGGAYKAPMEVTGIEDPLVREALDSDAYKVIVEDLDLLEGAGAIFDLEQVLAGKLTPVFFGSAINNFGIQYILDQFLKYANQPSNRFSLSTDGSKSLEVQTDHPKFSGFVFKIQANMDPKHRDRIAFIRICSGKFTRDLSVTHARTKKKIRLSSSHKLFGQERETVEEAYAGDIIGVIGHSSLRIGDTVTEDAQLLYDEIPSFAPEHFKYLVNEEVLQFKRFKQGLDQLLQEGVVQNITLSSGLQQAPILAAVGPLQYEVVKYRLESEYSAKTHFEDTSWTSICWLEPDLDTVNLKLPSGSVFAKDSHDRNVILFAGDWAKNMFQSDNPKIKLSLEPI